MESTRTILDRSNQIARQAAREHREPYNPWNVAEIEGYTTFPFPNIGSYRPKGWKLIGYTAADKTGYGADWEPALTTHQLKDWCIAQLNANPGRTIGFAIIEEGEFQAVIGAFVRLQRTAQNFAKQEPY